MTTPAKSAENGFLKPYDLTANPELAFNANVGTASLTAAYSVAHYRLLDSLPAAILYNKLVGVTVHTVAFAGSPRTDGYIYYTAQQFEATTGFKKKAFIRAGDLLCELGIVEKKVTYMARSDGTNSMRRATHFRVLIDLDKLVANMASKDPSCTNSRFLGETQESISEKLSIYNNNNKKTHTRPSAPPAPSQHKFKTSRPMADTTPADAGSVPSHSAVPAASPRVSGEPSTKDLQRDGSVQSTNAQVPSDAQVPYASLNETATESPLSESAPAAGAAPKAPFEADVKRERPADIAARDKKAENAALFALFKQLCDITNYKRSLTVQLRQKLRRAVKDYGADHLIEMAELYMSDSLDWWKPGDKRLYHFLMDGTLDRVDNATRSIDREPPFKKLDEKLLGENYLLHMNILLAAKSNHFPEVYSLDVNAPDFPDKAIALMNELRSKGGRR